MNPIEITTPGGHKVALKPYLTYNDIEPIMAAEALNATQKSAKLIEATVVSLNGETEKAYEKIRQLPMAEYKVIAEEVSKIINGNFSKEKSS